MMALTAPIFARLEATFAKYHCPEAWGPHSVVEDDHFNVNFCIFQLVPGICTTGLGANSQTIFCLLRLGCSVVIAEEPILPDFYRIVQTSR